MKCSYDVEVVGRILFIGKGGCPGIANSDARMLWSNTTQNYSLRPTKVTNDRSQNFSLHKLKCPYLSLVSNYYLGF